MTDETQSSNLPTGSMPQSPLAQAITAIKAGDLSTANQLLDSLLQDDPDNLNAWLWKSAAVHAVAERRHCLEQVLRIKPGHPQALRGLDRLPPQEEYPFQQAEQALQEPETQSSPAPSGDEQTQAWQEPDAINWALEPEQPDLAPEGPLGNVDPEAYLKSFGDLSKTAAAKAAEGQPQAFEWRFDLSESGEPDEGKGSQADFELFTTPEESLDRFLGIEPAHGNLRGFKEPEPFPEGQPIPAFIFDGAASQEDDLNLEDILAPQADQPAEGSQAASGVPRLPSAVDIRSGVPRLWANPGGKPNSLCILRSEYLVLANPDPLFMDRIREEVARGEVKKKSIGRTARAIPLNQLLRLTCEPEGSNFEVTYNGGSVKHPQTMRANAEFFSTDERDEVVEILADLLGPRFTIIEQNTTRLKAVLPPLVLMGLILVCIPLLAFAALTWLNGPAGSASLAQSVVILLAVLGLAGFGLGLVWLYFRLRQPLKLLVITTQPGE